MNSSDLFRNGDLTAAVDAALAEVKRNPTDVPSRFFLAELSCFAGDLERAERQLEALMQQSTEEAVLISLFRQLIRGETMRMQVFREGRPPELVTPLSEEMSNALQLLTHVRGNDIAKAVTFLPDATSACNEVKGTCNGKPFEGIRDLDDRIFPVLETITSTGKYFWTPWTSIEYLEFTKPQRAMDLLYRRALISVAGGPEGEVFVPTRYVEPVDSAQVTDSHKLARATDWIGDVESVIQGVGLRTFLVGEDDISLMELESIQFERE